MGVVTISLKQYENGKKAEELAQEIIIEAFKDAEIEIINDLIDFVVNGKYIEVKSCDKYISDKSHTTGRRRGRFILNKRQHEFLVKHDGLYLFIVRCEVGKRYIKFIRAKELDVTFNSEYLALNWRKVFGDKYE